MKPLELACAIGSLTGFIRGMDLSRLDSARRLGVLELAGNLPATLALLTALQSFVHTLNLTSPYDLRRREELLAETLPSSGLTVEEIEEIHAAPHHA